MFLRFILKLFKPSNEQLRGKSYGKITKAKIRFYQSSLRRLLKVYSHYMISDTITYSNQIKIVHEFRDMEFENELLRNKIDFKPQLVSISFPTTRTKIKHKRPFGYFKFKDLICIYVDDKELFIKHDDTISFDGTTDTKIKCSTSNDYLVRSMIEIIPAHSYQKQTKKTEEKYRVEGTRTHADIDDNNKNKKRKVNGGVFGREKVLPSINHKKPDNNADIPPVDEVDQTIEKKGFVIDTSF